ncbi:MAG: hypothetical protein ACLQQ4_15115 [Bacteroidia bacterium]
MKKTNDNQGKVLDYIKANAGTTIEAITEGTKVSNLLVRKVIKELLAENLITMGDAGEYTFVSKKNAAAEPKAVTKDEKKSEKKGAAKKNEEEDLGPKIKTGSRDTTRYSFNGETDLSKGKLVHAVIKKIASDNKKLSIEKIEEMFSGIQVRFGTIRKLEDARSFSKNKIDRFFLKPEFILEIGAKKEKAAICNQWSADTLKPFLKVASSLGMKIKAE